MCSGTSLNLWGLNTRAAATATLLGVNLGIITTNTTKLVESLREKEVEELYRVSWSSAVSVSITIYLPPRESEWAKSSHVFLLCCLSNTKGDLCSRLKIARPKVLQQFRVQERIYFVESTHLILSIYLCRNLKKI